MKRFFLNLQQMIIVMRPSCWHKNFGPNGLSAPTLGLCLNFFSSITADFNISSALSDTGPMVLWYYICVQTLGHFCMEMFSWWASLSGHLMLISSILDKIDLQNKVFRENKTLPAGYLPIQNSLFKIFSFT